MDFLVILERKVEVRDEYGGIGWREKILMVMICDLIGG